MFCFSAHSFAANAPNRSSPASAAMHRVATTGSGQDEGSLSSGKASSMAMGSSGVRRATGCVASPVRRRGGRG